MANISERKDKNGNIISYRIRVSRGYGAKGEKLKPYEKTYKPEKGMTKRQIEKELRESEYVLKKGNLFRLYSKKPVSEIKGKILLVSS